MKKRLFSALLIATMGISLLSGCSNNGNTNETESSETTVASGPVLLFEDEFDGTELNPTLWERCPEWDRQDGVSVWSNEMSYLNGEGNLVLRAEWDEELEKVVSGAVRTYGLFEQGYGYYEASIKFPVVRGVWGAFWMMVGDVHNVENKSVDGVEIDIVESIGNRAGHCNQALHWDGYGSEHKKSANEMTECDYIYDGEFHTFGLWRTEEVYIFYIDGNEVWRTSGGGICPEDGYMKLTVEAAKWNGAGTKAAIKTLPADMLVDYVRVWDTKPE